jgi:hypothetical protein
MSRRDFCCSQAGAIRKRARPAAVVAAAGSHQRRVWLPGSGRDRLDNARRARSGSRAIGRGKRLVDTARWTFDDGRSAEALYSK